MCVTTSMNAQKTIFWEVKDTLNNKISYVLGTCHIVGASFLDSFDIRLVAMSDSNFM